MAEYASQGKRGKPRLVRLIVCKACILKDDTVLGASWMARKCPRCEKAHEFGIVVERAPTP